MDAKLKADWVAALRSGEFKQADSMLHDRKTDSYCCLGVLCKVMGAEFGPAIEEGDEEFGPSSFDYVPVLNGRVLSAGEDEELKTALCDEIGIPDQGDLIRRNDGMGTPNSPDHLPRLSFPEIADYIEKNL